MKEFRLPHRGRILYPAVVLCLFLSLLFLILSFVLPFLAISPNEQKTLGLLRNHSRAIQAEFSRVLETMAQRRQKILATAFPGQPGEIFDLFKKMRLDIGTEGIGYYSPEKKLELWLGNVIELQDQMAGEGTLEFFQGRGASVLIQDRASVYLISIQPLRAQGYAVFYRLLAFLPQFKAPSLTDYHFLGLKLQRNCEIDYWDFREDVSGFERIFAKHKDEYIGQPRLQGEIQTLFFPLRNEHRSILATVTLSSPSLSSRRSGLQENMLLAFYLGLALSLILLIISFFSSPGFPKKKRVLPGALLIPTLIGLRLVFFPISHLERVRSLPMFSPTLASFFSLGNLTKSPADIFLTSLVFSLVLASLGIHANILFRSRRPSSSLAAALAWNGLAIAFSFVVIFAFQRALFQLVNNSNLNLLRFSLNASFILLHLSLLLFSAGLFFMTFILLKAAAAATNHPSVSIFFLVIGAGSALFLWRNVQPFLFSLLQVGLAVAIFLMVIWPVLLRSRERLFIVFAAGVLFIYASLDHYRGQAVRGLLENVLRNTVITQPRWGDFVMQRSFPEIDKQSQALLSLFWETKPSDLAATLWRSTVMAKTNWYSSLEILNPDGDILSSFSLNVPKIYSQDWNLPLNPRWSVSRHRLLLMGREKDFLVGYKDWFEEEAYRGRTVLALSIDQETLPFLYSANPYFELLRSGPLPSLNQIEFGFAVFDSEGQLLFNPHKLTSGIPPELLSSLRGSGKPLWSVLKDNQKSFNALCFWSHDRIYIFFTPQKTFVNLAVEYLKLFFFDLFFIFLGVLLASPGGPKARFRNPFWSFSNRVYASFIAVAFVPLLLFTFFAHSFFDQIFSRRYVEEATLHAGFARSIMEDFISLQQEEKASPVIPPEDLVQGISSTIANDVNLFREGRLISSSRRELFDSGLLSGLIDGETYYRVRHENTPFYTQRQRIGDYSFQTLSIPYYFQDSLFLISLPFPFEEQEIAGATGQLLEFLFFISAFVIGLVLIFARAFGTMIVRPIQKLLVGTKEVSLGNLEVTIDYKPRDEMRTLIEGFNTMIQSLKEHQLELAEMGKKVAWAEMARRVAHEIKNPLTPIQLSAEHLLRVYEDKDGNFEEALKESISYIISEVENLRRIAQDFMEISRDAVLQKEPFDLKLAIGETLGSYKKLLSKRILFREVYEGRDFQFLGDKAKIKVALKNIIINAIEAIRGKGEIEIRAKREAGAFKIEIRDTGVGMSAETLERIFQPYFSTKEAGTGLGLPIAKKIIEEHGGSIQVVSEPLRGTQITVEFPGES